MSQQKIIYVLVEVLGVEDEAAAVAAIENLSNAEQVFDVTQTKDVLAAVVDELGGPVIYFP